MDSNSPTMRYVIKDAIASFRGDIVGHFRLIKNKFKKLGRLKLEFFSFNASHV